MSSELILRTLCWDKDSKLDWGAGFRFIEALDYEDGVLEGEDGEYTLTELCAYLRALMGATSGNINNTQTYLWGIGHLKMLVTGGDSWGDSPSEFFQEWHILGELGVLPVVGFLDTIVDWKGIMCKILESTNLIPALLHIDPALDKLIESHLKKE